MPVKPERIPLTDSMGVSAAGSAAFVGGPILSPVPPSGGSTRWNTRLSVGVYAELVAYCEKEDRTMTYVAERAVAEWLERNRETG